jgi:hypothetical protein
MSHMVCCMMRVVGSGSVKAKVSPVDHSGSQWMPLILSFSKQMELQKSSHIVLF